MGIKDQYRGSEWRKWDLHIHSPASVLNNQFEGSNDEEKWNNYFEKLESLENISVLGITDYLSIEGYKKVKKYKEEGNLKNIDLLLPNLELRILPVTDDPCAINIHIIFSPSVVTELESKFFSKLEFRFREETFSATRNDLIKLGRKFKNNEELDEYSAYTEGVNQFKVHINDLKEIFNKNPTLREEAIVSVSNSSRNGASGIQHTSLAAIREDIYNFSDAIFSSNPNDREYFLGKRTDSIDEIKRKYGRLMPCIHGSDAHTLELICKPDFNRYCWIKADPTFEGLIQIIYEPELRVRIQEENPIESETYPKIYKFIINLPSNLEIKKQNSEEKTKFCLRGKYVIEFSNNLTCLIGGRGTGKSSLLHLLYNSWINCDIEKMSEDKINSPINSLDLIPNPLSRLRELSDSNIPPETEFFFQDEIEEYAKSTESMSKVISQRLKILSKTGELKKKRSLTDLEYDWHVSLDSFKDLIQCYDKIIDINNHISELQNIIDTLENQIKVITSEEYKMYQDHILKITNKISEFNKYEREINLLIERLTTVETLLAGYKWKESQGYKILEDLKKDIKDYKVKIIKKLNEVKENYEAENFHRKLLEEKRQLRKYLEDKGLSPENIEDLADANEKIANLKMQIDSQKTEKKPYDEIFRQKEKILKKYQKAYKTYKDRFFEVSNLLKSRIEELSLTEKNLTFEPYTNYSLLQEKIGNFIKDSCAVEQENISSIIFEKLLFQNDNINIISDFAKNKDNIKKHVNNLTVAEKHRTILREFVNNEDYLNRLHLRIIKHYFNVNNIRLQVKLEGRLLKNTSFGERCGIVVAIILVAGINPVVIDQPEDHLDGKFISQILVPLIRRQKSNRQIIIVTRNANIAIGGDAELIQILESEKSRTEIYSSSIENIEQRKKYIWILDGGEEAFTIREQKYNIANIE